MDPVSEAAQDDRRIILNSQEVEDPIPRRFFSPHIKERRVRRSRAMTCGSSIA